MFQEPEFDHELYFKWLKERASEYSKTKQSRFVTISREYGCDAYPIAVKLAEILRKTANESNWLIFSHPVMEKLVADKKLGAELIDRVSEKRYSFMNWFIDDLAPDYLKSTQSEVFRRMQTLILNLAEKGNCIILGGGSQIITGKLDPQKFLALHVRIIGSYEYRLKKVMERFGLNKTDAEKQIKSKQYARNKFVHDFTGVDSSDSLLYNIIINSDHCHSEIIAKTLSACLESKFPLKGRVKA